MKEHVVAAKIDLDQLELNYHLIKEHIGNACEFMAVVKANAYGHGAVKISEKLSMLGVKHFGVATIEEAIELRQAGIIGEILVFGSIVPSCAGSLEQYDLTCTVSSAKEAHDLLQHVKALKCHINIDTGMSRYGIYCHSLDRISETIDEIKRIRSMGKCDIRGIYTHFANAISLREKHTLEQFNIFSALLKSLDDAGIGIPFRHVANSGATLLYKEMHLDMVRVGIALYGYPQVETALDLLPVMTLTARVASIRMIEKQDAVSYGRTYIAKRQMRIATLAYGYEDGYPRILSNRGYVIFDGKRLPIIGRVCMDAMMIDTLDTSIRVGDEVTVFGKEKTAAFMAKSSKTIVYEILTSLGRRVDRLYTDSEIQKHG